MFVREKRIIGYMAAAEKLDKAIEKMDTLVH